MTKHIIIGGGPVATNALETIRQFDTEAEITLICNEPAHSRMVLPYWLAGQVPREQTHTADDAYYQKYNVTARIGATVCNVDPQNNSITLDDGDSLEFDNLLIATGATPLGLDIPGIDLPSVQSLWSLTDTDNLINAANPLEKPRVLMIGAGFIGLIMLNAMYKRGWDLTVVERESQVLPRMLDADAAGIAASWLETKGVSLHTGASVIAITATDSGAKLVELASGEKIETDVVIVATGIKPNLDLVQNSGIEIDNGVLINDQCQTNIPNIYAGGDIAQGPVLGGGSDQRVIHPIQPTAVDHGRIAGANMSGHETHYPGSLLMNILDICGLQNASFGNWSDTTADCITISNPVDSIYRKLLWTDDRITGAIFCGKANDMGMLTDVGMVKGIVQTQTALGPWKDYLRENPFDIRRAYVANNVARKLTDLTLLGRPAQPRQFHFKGQVPTTNIAPAHAVYVDTKEP